MINRYKIISLILIISAFLFGGTWWGFCLGDEVFSILGIAPWSHGTSGTHYVALISLVPLLLGVSLFMFSRKLSHQYKRKTT